MPEPMAWLCIPDSRTHEARSEDAIAKDGETLSGLEDVLRVDVSGDDLLVRAGFGQHVSPWVDDRGVAAELVPGVGADSVAGDHVSLRLDCPRLGEQPPVPDPLVTSVGP